MANPVKMTVWDGPIRLFHWSLAISASLGLYSGFMNKFDSAELMGISLGQEWGTVHLWCGYSVLGLCLFRLVWGILGSSNAKLWTLVASPMALFSYAKTLHQPAKSIGRHNPIGAYASLLLILGFLAQAGMGLYAMDDYFYEGPLASEVTSSDSKELTSLHKKWGPWLIGFSIFHVAAVLFYVTVRKRNLITPMITGTDTLSDGIDPPAIAPQWRFLLAISITALIVWYWVG